VATAYQGFQARAFHPALGNEAVEGSACFSPRALSFRGGETSIDFPLHRLVADLDEEGEGKVILTDPEQPDWTIVVSDRGLLEIRSIPQIAALTDQLEARLTRNELWRRGKVALWFSAGCALVLWLGMVGVGAMVRSIVGKVSPDAERQYGNGLLDELRAELEFVDDTNQVARLASTAEPLLRVVPARQQWQFYVVKEDSPNAFALPGGHILVTTGLLRLVDRPEQLLGAMAHEVAHVMQKHGFRQQVASAGPLLIFRIFLRGRGGALAVATGASALLVNQSFSQEYEKEADDEGWNYLVAANIDPRGMTEVFRKLKAAEGAEERVRILPKAFESHPDIDKRIARLEAKWKRMRRKSGFLELNSAAEGER
jgi:Zn-dependent protease with chaperone function